MTASTRSDRATIRTTIAVIVGVLAVVFDSTIVSVALRRLAIDLHTDLATVQWVTTGYLLALGLSIPLVGWLQSRLGGKRLWMAALAVFLLGSVLCSVSWDAPSLIVFRVIQGLGGGAMLPLTTTLIVQAAGSRDLGRLMAAAALPAALGPILGPVLGGLILGLGNWRWIFLVNVPVCLVGLLLAALLLPADTEHAPRRLDIVGLLLLSPALIALLWGLSNVSRSGGFGRLDVVAPLVAGVALLVGFVLWARRRGEAALVDVRILRHRATWSASVLMFLMGASLYGAMVLLPLYWQELRGADALGAGLLLIGQGAGTLVTRTIAPRLMDRLGARAVVLLGFALAAAATVPFALADAGTSIWLLEAVLVVRGFGLGLVVIPITTVAFVGLERAEVPYASIVTRVAQQVGASVGVAVLAVVLTTTATAARSAVTGFQVAFWCAVAFSAVALVVALVLPRRVPVPAAAPAGSAASGAAARTGAH